MGLCFDLPELRKVSVNLPFPDDSTYLPPWMLVSLTYSVCRGRQTMNYGAQSGWGKLNWNAGKVSRIGWTTFRDKYLHQDTTQKCTHQC